MFKKDMFSYPAIYVVAVLYILLSYTVLALGDQIVAMAVREDHYFESVGALSFFVASILFFLSFLQTRRAARTGVMLWIKPLIFLGMAAMFFFGAGEEISWGQRIFNVATPQSIDQINDQGEITVHNLSFGGVNIPFETMFDLFWMSFAFLLPFAAKFIKPFRLLVEKYLPISHWGIGLLFMFNYLYAKVAKEIFAPFYTYDRIPFQQAVQEIKEGNYALMFALVALFLFLNAMGDARKPAA